MLSKQEEIVDHGSQLEIVIQPPDDDEATKDSSPEHEEPFLHKEAEDPHTYGNHHCDNDGDVDVITKELDVDRGQDEPSDEETNAGTCQEYSDVVDTDGE